MITLLWDFDFSRLPYEPYRMVVNFIFSYLYSFYLIYYYFNCLIQKSLL